MNIAAFFDIDGTLVPPPSLEKRFVRYLRWRGEIGVSQYLRWLWEFLGPRGQRDAGATRDWATRIAQNKACLTGVPVASMDAWLCWLARHPIEHVPEALRRIRWHARHGHCIVLLSGTLEPLALAVARSISAPVHVRATRLETEGGRFTGRMRGETVCGPAKARAMETLAEKFSLDLPRSYAYGDSFADRWMLARVGTPFVVQTTNSISWRLARVARRRGWPVLRWNEATRAERFASHCGAEFAEERRGIQSVATPPVKCR